MVAKIATTFHNKMGVRATKTQFLPGATKMFVAGASMGKTSKAGSYAKWVRVEGPGAKWAKTKGPVMGRRKK